MTVNKTELETVKKDPEKQQKRLDSYRLALEKLKEKKESK